MMMYTLKEPRGFFYMGSDSAIEANLLQTGLELSDFKEVSDDEYESLFNPPEGKYLVFDENGPRLEDLPATNYVKIAETERQSLLDAAAQSITIWQTKLLMGRKLTDTETESLNAWMDYIDVLNDTDISDAPDVQWPTKPAV